MFLKMTLKLEDKAFAITTNIQNTKFICSCLIHSHNNGTLIHIYVVIR